MEKAALDKMPEDAKGKAAKAQELSIRQTQLINAQKALISFYFKNSKLLCLDVFEIILEKLELE